MVNNVFRALQLSHISGCNAASVVIDCPLRVNRQRIGGSQIGMIDIHAYTFLSAFHVNLIRIH